MSESNVRVVARVVARPDKVDELREVLLGLLGPTRSEAGCIQYDLLQNATDPTDFTFVEEWTSFSALEAHLGSDHLQQAISVFSELVAVEPDIQHYHQLG